MRMWQKTHSFYRDFKIATKYSKVSAQIISAGSALWAFSTKCKNSCPDLQTQHTATLTYIADQALLLQLLPCFPSLFVPFLCPYPSFFPHCCLCLDCPSCSGASPSSPCTITLLCWGLSVITLCPHDFLDVLWFIVFIFEDDHFKNSTILSVIQLAFPQMHHHPRDYCFGGWAFQV